MSSTSSLSTAVLARLLTVTGVTVYDGKVPTTPVGAYVVFYGNAGIAANEGMASTPNGLRWGFYLVVAGTLPGQVRTAVDRVREALTGFRIDTAAAASPLNEDDLRSPMLRDDTVQSDVRFSQTLYYRLSASRS